MKLDEYIEEQKLLSVFQTKAEKCKTKEDMKIFCKSFLAKYSGEDIKIPDPLPDPFLGDRVHRVHFEGGQTVALRKMHFSYCMSEHRLQNLNSNHEADLIAYRELSNALSAKIIEIPGLLSIKKEKRFDTCEQIWQSTLIVGKQI